MKKPRAAATRRRVIFLCGVMPVILTAALAIYRPAFLLRLDRAVYDTLARAATTTEPSGRVVVVDVDERSLTAIGQWPWRRDVVARLLDRLRELGASVIALDIIFAEPDRESSSGNFAGSRDAIPRMTPDDALRQAIGRGRVVMGYAMTFEAPARARSACVLHPLSLATFHSRDHTTEAPYFQATGAVCNLPALSRSAVTSGFLNAAPDSDGILRRVPLLIELDGRVYPALALTAVAAATNARDFALRISNVNASSLLIGDRAIPLDGKANALLRYRGRKRTFPYVSAADALDGNVDPGALRDKIVFVGTTALGTREVVATPLDTLFAGVEVQATVADNLLTGDVISRSVYAATLEIQTVLLLGFALAGLVATRGIVSGAVVGTGGIAAVWIGSISLYATSGTFVSPLFPTTAAASALLVMTAAKFAVERVRAERAGREKAAAQRLMVETLLSLTAVRDAETGNHSRRTQQYTLRLAEQLCTSPAYRDYLTAERIDLMASLAPLHDIGKVGIPDHILNKPGPLTPDELELMRRHPIIGLEVIVKAERETGVRDNEILQTAKDIVYTHHERWDGTGYPRGLRGPEIPLAGRIVALVDVYDAMVTRTLYRPTLSHEAAVALIVRGKGTLFEPQIVEAFVCVAESFHRIAIGAAEASCGTEKLPAPCAVGS